MFNVDILGHLLPFHNFVRNIMVNTTVEHAEDKLTRFPSKQFNITLYLPSNRGWVSLITFIVQ